MGIVGVVWTVLIVLKLLGVALVTTSWVWVLLWPIVPIVIFALLALIFGITAAGFTSFRRV